LSAAKTNQVDLGELRGKVLANARACWCSFVTWDQLSRSREQSEVASLFYSTKWQFLPFENGLFVDVLIRMVVLFDDKPDQVSFHAYRGVDKSLPNVDSKYLDAIRRIRCIRHNAIAHWNSQQNLSGWIATFQLSITDVELALACVRELHDFLLALQLAEPPDKFGILEISTRNEINEFIEVLRDAARFKLVDAQSRDQANALYAVVNG
jgi:hypothetical protein